MRIFVRMYGNLHILYLGEQMVGGADSPDA
jgi:hypothetical protein